MRAVAFSCTPLWLNAQASVRCDLLADLRLHLHVSNFPSCSHTAWRCVDALSMRGVCAQGQQPCHALARPLAPYPMTNGTSALTRVRVSCGVAWCACAGVGSCVLCTVVALSLDKRLLPPKPRSVQPYCMALCRRALHAHGACACGCERRRARRDRYRRGWVVVVGRTEH